MVRGVIPSEAPQAPTRDLAGDAGGLPMRRCPGIKIPLRRLRDDSDVRRGPVLCILRRTAVRRYRLLLTATLS